MMQRIKLKDLRGCCSKIDPISVCMRDTLDYKNYGTIDSVPEEFDEKYVCGIGIIESEIDDTFKTCIEIVLCDSDSTE